MKSTILLFTFFLSLQSASTVQIISKSKLEKCEKVSDSKEKLNCTSKIVLDLSVPSESNGRDASIVAELVEVEENSTNKMRTLRVPPVITVNKSAAYVLYELTYMRDVAYKPQEFYVQTRKCEPDAGESVVKICERLQDDKGHIIEHTQPTCCPCGDQRRVPSSCGNFFDNLIKGKANTAHCLRFPGDWFHVFGIGQRSVGFTVRIQIKTRSKTSEVIVGPENRTAASSDHFLRANLIGDYTGYSNIPSFDDYYLVIPRQGGQRQPQSLGNNISTWMLLERVRFTLDGLECDKIGVSYEAFNGQPDFCSSPYWSCLHNQLWNFWEADQNRISRNQVPLYSVQGRFERINQHPDAGSHAFSIGITEVLNSNLLIELNADDVDYVFQRSPGKILSITVPTFEALTQFGTATITTKNIGEVEASYSLTFDCSTGVSHMEEQFYIMKPNEVLTRSFKLFPSSDQAAKYVCSAILKDSDFTEVDRAECQFTTTATTLDNGSQIAFQPANRSGNGLTESIKEMWNKLWGVLTDFITGKACREKCRGFFDFGCHIQYICMSWLLLFGLLLPIIPTVLVLLWLLHQKGVFDPLYEWWEDHFWGAGRSEKRKYGVDADATRINLKKNYEYEARSHRHHRHERQRSREPHKNNHVIGETDYEPHRHNHVFGETYYKPHRHDHVFGETSYEPYRHNHVFGEPHRHNQVYGEPHRHNHVLGEPHRHNQVYGEPHRHNHVFGEPHRHNQAFGEPHRYNHAFREPHGHNHVFGEPHGHNHVFGEPHGHNHVFGEPRGHNHVFGEPRGHNHVLGEPLSPTHVLGEPHRTNHVLGEPHRPNNIFGETDYEPHGHNNVIGGMDYRYHLPHVHKHRNNHRRTRSSGIPGRLTVSKGDDERVGHRILKQRDTLKRIARSTRNRDGGRETYSKHKYGFLDNAYYNIHSKRKE